MVNWKACRRKKSWPILGTIPRFVAWAQRNTKISWWRLRTEILSQDLRKMKRDWLVTQI